MNEPMGKMTISDVAEALGISKTTVSRAISGKGRIGKETRQKVQNYITEHHYTPNVIARGLAQSKTYNIALVLPGDYYLSELPFFQNCMLGISRAAGEADYDVLISMVTGEDLSQLQRVVEYRKVDGVILSRTLVEDQPLQFLMQHHLPYVAIGSTREKNVVQVDHDHVNACRALTEHVLMQGFRRIALLGGNRNHIVTQQRYKGYQEALRQAGMKKEAGPVYFDIEDEVTVEKIADELIHRGTECILCMDDYICLRTLSVLTRKGVRVPKDLKVASFYNSQLLKNQTPGITALNFNTTELGEAACRMLIRMMNGEEVPKHTLQDYELVVKESTRV